MITVINDSICFYFDKLNDLSKNIIDIYIYQVVVEDNFNFSQDTYIIQDTLFNR